MAEAFALPATDWRNFDDLQASTDFAKASVRNRAIFGSTEGTRRADDGICVCNVAPRAFMRSGWIVFLILPSAWPSISCVKTLIDRNRQCQFDATSRSSCDRALCLSTKCYSSAQEIDTSSIPACQCAIVRRSGLGDGVRTTNIRYPPSFLVDYPFADRLYPRALDVVARLRTLHLQKEGAASFRKSWDSLLAGSGTRTLAPRPML